jgi:hypothetical protein
MLARPQPLAQALAAMLKRAEPPVCVGLYARWGSGKTFMISLLKQEFDRTVREDPDTRQLLQFFEEGYADLKPKNDLEDDPKIYELSTVCSLVFDVLHIIIFSIILGPIFSFIPYGVTTFSSIICDALRQASRKAWNWCSKLQRSCKPKAKTIDSGDGDEDSGKASCMAGIYSKYQKLTGVDDEDDEDQEIFFGTEFIFVHFNAWECAACVPLLCRHHGPGRRTSLTSRLMIAQIFPI